MQRCNRCVMDDRNDRFIRFDEQGVCNYCSNAIEKINTTTYFPGTAEGDAKLEAMLNKIKKDGEGKPYDCVMGLSGGLDSSYLAYLGYKWGLRILAVHIDDGYDTPISKANLEKLCKAAHIEMKTIVPDQKQYDDLLLAYLKAGVPNIAIPQDNILFAFLYDTVKKSGVRYFLSGGNFALESILQKDHVFNAMDVVNIRDIHRRFGTEKMDKLKFISSYRKYWREKRGTAISLRPLNYVDYQRDRAFQELYDFCGFEYYGAKHLENVLTAFAQCYWFPKKFGVDKRTSHLSSLIVSGQMTREDALKELEKPICDEQLMESYIEIIKKRLNLSDEEFDRLMEAEPHEHTDYRTDNLHMSIRKLIKKCGL